MGRIVNKRVEDRSQMFSDICCDIYSGEYVLVLGGDVVLKTDYAEGNSQKYILDDFRKDFGGPDLTMGPQQYKNKIKKFLSEDWSYDLGEVSDDLISLLSTKCFRLVLTTSFDGYLESAMRKVFGDELRVMNIYNPADLKSFAVGSEYGTVPPTLFYAFGKAESEYDFVLSENDAIKLISRWLGNDAPTGLIEYMKDKKILAAGCKFDDWYFRFFWYCLRQDFENLSGDVAISLQTDSSESDRKLAAYLSKINVENKGNSREFVAELSRRLANPAVSVYDKFRHNLQRGGVFISYASEDFPIVCQVFSALLEAGFRVWFDRRELTGGAQYDTRISNAIRECRIFVPILSRQTKIDLTSGNSRYYKDVEWNEVRDNKDCVIIPVQLHGFEIGKDRDLLPEIFRRSSVVDWAAEGKEGIVKAVENSVKK